MTDDTPSRLARIETKLDVFLKRAEEDRDRLNNHGDRLGKLERWQSKVLGAVAVATFVIGYVLKKYGW